ncbi:MAG: hypothetical protein E6H53_03010 [Betaproteobacteria bacterium]|nr:MAG: hypothetical protein E6H53_03010 [Betaproteobacteria bacterium]
MNGPLRGAGIVITRPARQAAGLAREIAALGGDPLIFPAIVILPPEDEAALRAAQRELARYDIAIFVSANAVEYGVGDPAAWPANILTLAPGPGTAAALAHLGIANVRIPTTSMDSEGLLALPELAAVANKRVVIFRGDTGRELLKSALEAGGASVTQIECYRRAAPESGAAGLLEAWREKRIDAVTLTSSEGLDNLWAILDREGKDYLAATPTFVPHPRIAEHARGFGLDDVIVTPPADAGLLASLLEYFATHPPIMQPDILVTAPLPPFLYEPLKADYRCHDYYQSSHKPGLLAAEGARVRGLVQGGGTLTPTELLDKLPKLEIISVFGVGYDGVPVAYCKERGLKVTNTPDVLTDDVADVALGLILMTGRGFVRLNRFVQAGEWEKRGPELTTKLGGRKVGVLGLGRIGKAIAQRVAAMGMKVAYTGRKPQDVPYEYMSDLRSLAAAVDFLVVACPGGPATKNIVDSGVLAALGKKGTLINIARGSIVDETALVTALKAGSIKGAGLDVFADEPHIPAELLAMDNVVLLPHVGSATRETRQAMGDLCKANLDAYFGGKGVLTLIPELR